ncbi:MAG: hypothetical protein GY810_20150 [Aureispira sp.]|nr:hypothetical protein [Aureispira sp.]
MPSSHSINIKKLFFLALVVKACALLLLWYSLESYSDNSFFRCRGDGHYYLKRAQNITKYGTFAFHLDENQKPIPYIGRMPGYEPFIAPVNFISKNKNHQVVMIGIAQLIISYFASILLALLFFQFTKKRLLTYLFLGVYSANTYLLTFDLMVLSESLGISTFIAALYFFFKFTRESKQGKHLFISGIFLCWAIFLRPYLAPFAILLGLYLIYILRKDQQTASLKILVKYLFIFLCTFSVLDSWWIARNYYYRGEFVPLVKTDFYAEQGFNEITTSTFDFVRSWGGDIVYWNPPAEITYFFNDLAGSGLKPTIVNIDDLPSYLFSEQITKEKIVGVRDMIREHFKEKDKAKKKQLELATAKEIRALDTQFKAENPFGYHVLARLRLFKSFVGHNGTYNLNKSAFHELNFFRKGYKLFYALYYFLTMLLGSIATLYFLLKRRESAYVLLIFVAAYMYALCPFVLRMIEYRYALLSYPFFLFLFFAMLSYWDWTWLTKRLNQKAA